MKRTTFLLALLCLTVPLAAQTQEFERVLIPIAIGEIPGAHGSLWTSDLCPGVLGSDAFFQVKTIAEAIETEQQLQLCKDLQIELGQGYIFARPAPWPDIKDFR